MLLLYFITTAQLQVVQTHDYRMNCEYVEQMQRAATARRWATPKVLR